jgi:hypothetical protein
MSATITTTSFLKFTVNPLNPNLNIVLQGNSILVGANADAGFTPRDAIADAKPTAIVTDVSLGGGDILNLIANISNVTNLYNPSRTNIAILLETINYINDTRGEAAFGGDGLSLSDPDAAGQAYYSLVLDWVANVRSANFLACVCTSSNAYETTASPLSNNILYAQARDKAHTLMRTNMANFDYFADPASDSRFQTTTDGTYFYADQIHLVNAGYYALGTLIAGVI